MKCGFLLGGFELQLLIDYCVNYSSLFNFNSFIVYAIIFMASFFRWRIANKILPFLAKSDINPKHVHPSVISSYIRVGETKGKAPQLFLPWKRITKLSFQPDALIDPKELVTNLKNQGLPTAEGFTDITFCAYPLSIVFTVDEHVFSKIVLTDICGNDEIIAKSSCLFQDVSPKKIVIKCSVPSVGETFQMSHFRSAMHSNFIANINKVAGHDVIKVMHVGDYGLISALMLAAYKKFGNENELSKDPTQHLVEIWTAANQLYKKDQNFENEVKLCFKKMEEGDTTTCMEWSHLKNCCLKQWNCIYEKIGLTFDDTHFDSSYYSEISKTEEDLIKKNIVTVESGKVIFNVPSESSLENNFMNNDNNAAVYNLSRAICSVIQKKEKYDFDEMYFVTSKNERHFLSVLFSLIKALGFQWSENLHHIQLANINYFVGKRKQINTEKIFTQAKTEMLNILKSHLQLQVDEAVDQMAEALGYASVCVYDMKHKRNFEYKFNWSNILSLERESGASLQLCHAALKGLQEDSPYTFKVEIDTSPLLEREAHMLVHHLSKFDEVVHKSYMSLEPHFILQYLFSLWYFIDKASNSLKLDIKEDRLTVLKARLMLLQASLKVLQKGLHLLGITPFETNYTPPDFVKP